MKKSILGLILGFLLIGTNGFAADGDLIVNGKIGVGTTSPAEKLDVNGNVKATGFIGPGIIKQVLTVSPTSNISTSSTTFVDMPGMEITLNTGNSILLIFWNATVYNPTGYNCSVETLLDGVRAGPVFGGNYTNLPGYGPSAIAVWAGGHAVTPTTAGTHTVKLRWKVQSGTSQNSPTATPDYYGRTLTVIEVGQ